MARGAMCCCYSNKLVMNGGNCSSFCPVSRRETKPPPRQTMPICGAWRAPQPHKPGSVQAPPVPHRALGPQPVAPSSRATLAGSQGGLGKAKVCWPMVPGVYIHMAPRVLGCWRPAMARRCVEAGRASLLCQLQAGERKRASIIHTHQRQSWGGGWSSRSHGPASGGGELGLDLEERSPHPTHVASGYRLGALTLL